MNAIKLSTEIEEQKSYGDLSGDLSDFCWFSIILSSNKMVSKFAIYNGFLVPCIAMGMFLRLWA